MHRDASVISGQAARRVGAKLGWTVPRKHGATQGPGGIGGWGGGSRQERKGSPGTLQTPQQSRESHRESDQDSSSNPSVGRTERLPLSESLGSPGKRNMFSGFHKKETIHAGVDTRWVLKYRALLCGS